MVEAIRDKKAIRGELHYLVKWQGYPEAENSWEPAKKLVSEQVVSAMHSTHF